MNQVPSNNTSAMVQPRARPLRRARRTPGPSPTFSPLYQQIKALITQSLQSGEWKPGELIPSEVELANRYKVSQGTVRKAIDELAADNLVMRRQGKGTFVATHHEARAHIRFLRCARTRASPTTRPPPSSKSSACARRPMWRACWT
jgi:GntR family transcriptional regulator